MYKKTSKKSIVFYAFFTKIILLSVAKRQVFEIMEENHQK